MIWQYGRRISVPLIYTQYKASYAKCNVLYGSCRPRGQRNCSEGVQLSGQEINTGMRQISMIKMKSNVEQKVSFWLLQNSKLKIPQYSINYFTPRQESDKCNYVKFNYNQASKAL